MPTYATFVILALSPLLSRSLPLPPAVFQAGSAVEAGWIPPKTTIDPKYVDAARRLLGNGLADPRTGTFCVVKPLDVQGVPALWQLRYGWVSADRKWLNGLDGVVSPVRGRIEPANLEEAMDAFFRQREKEKFSLNHSDLSPATPAILLLRGETSLAERALVSSSGPGDTPQAMFEYLARSYEVQANLDLKEKKDSDGLRAVSNWESVLKIRGPLPDGNRRQYYPYVWSNSFESEEKFAADLVADFKKRLSSPRANVLDPAALRGLTQKERIAKLIVAFGEDSPMLISDSGPFWNMDPICQALSAEGSAAIPPLLDALEQDRRFTRSVNNRYFGALSPGELTRTAQGEWAAIQMIWPSAIRYVPEHSFPSAATLRAAWEKERSIPRAQRWVNLLKDDQAGPKLWLEAAEQLVNPIGQLRLYGSHGIHSHGTMTGESLRASEGVEISRMMNLRAEEMVQKKGSASLDHFQVTSALRIAHLSYLWNRSSSLGCLEATYSSTKETLSALAHDGNLKDDLASSFGVVIADRLALGDIAAVQDYAEIVPYVKPEEWFNDPGFFRPYWVAKDNPEIREIGAKYMKKWGAIFGSPENDLWRSSLESALHTLPMSELLEFGPYRQLLVRAIETDVPMGESEVFGRGSNEYAVLRIKQQNFASWGIPANERAGVSVGVKSAYSVGDYVAQSLGRLIDGVPHFSILLPPVARGAGRKAIVKWLSDDSRDWKAIAKSKPYNYVGDLN